MKNYLKHTAVLFGYGLVGAAIFGMLVAGLGGAGVMIFYGSGGILISALLAAFYCKAIE